MVKQLVKRWFENWEKGDFQDIPISDDFQHTSPFGTIDGKQAYMKVVADNKAKFLGYTFEIHDAIYEKERACVRYTARQGEDFTLDVSEWYYLKKDLIGKIVSHYHIGEIREDRQLS